METTLPPEMIIKIFQQLCPRDLKNVVMVCKMWKMLAEDPSLWTWCQVAIQNTNDLKKLSLSRLKWIENVILTDCHPHSLNMLLKRFERLPKLKMITGLSCENLTYVEPNLLARVVNKVEYAEWCFLTNITSEQAEIVFKQMSEKTELLEMKVINSNKKLHSINTKVLASALNKLEVLWISDSITASQTKELFSTMSNGTKLTVLCLCDINLSMTQATDLAKGVSRLKVLIFLRVGNKPYDTDLSASQAIALFTIISKGTQLEVLQISTKQLPRIKASTLAKALNNLEDVSLNDSKITSEQVQAIFKVMSEDTKLKSLDSLRHNLSMIPPSNFGKGLSRVETVSLRHCHLTKDQVIALFLAISSGSQLKVLDLSFNKLSSMEPYFLARGVNMVEQVNLTRTFLTSEQINCIFTVFLEEDTNLECLSIESIDVQKGDPELVAKARLKFKEGNF